MARSSAGLQSVDELLEGGMPLGRLGIFRASQGCGKTSYGLQIARKNAERGFHTRFITFSMPGNLCQRYYETALRYEAPASRLPANLRRFGGWDFSDRDCTYDLVERVEEMLQAERAQGRDIQVVVIDSLEEMAERQPGQIGRGLGARYERLSNLAVSLRDMAAKNDLAVWLTIQGNDYSRSNNPTLESISAGRRKVSESAYVWLGLLSNRDSTPCDLECHKNRGGSTFSIRIQHEQRSRRFLDLDYP